MTLLFHRNGSLVRYSPENFTIAAMVSLLRVGKYGVDAARCVQQLLEQDQ